AAAAGDVGRTRSGTRGADQPRDGEAVPGSGGAVGGVPARASPVTSRTARPLHVLRRNVTRAPGYRSSETARFLQLPSPHTSRSSHNKGECSMRVPTLRFLGAFALAPLLGSCDAVRNPAQPAHPTLSQAATPTILD